MVVETWPAATILTQSPPTFSILGRIVVVETTVWRDNPEDVRLAFSILGRIVVVETRGSRVGGPGGIRFQYPRTDRGG